jgi:hypothetical protein
MASSIGTFTRSSFTMSATRSVRIATATAWNSAGAVIHDAPVSSAWVIAARMQRCHCGGQAGPAIEAHYRGWRCGEGLLELGLEVFTRDAIVFDHNAVWLGCCLGVVSPSAAVILCVAHRAVVHRHIGANGFSQHTRVLGAAGVGDDDAASQRHSCLSCWVPAAPAERRKAPGRQAMWEGSTDSPAMTKASRAPQPTV